MAQWLPGLFYHSQPAAGACADPGCARGRRYDFGEANMGTLRLLVSRPVSRTRLLLIKFLAAAIYTLVLLIWVAILALGVSMLMFNQFAVRGRETESNVIFYDNTLALWRGLPVCCLGLVTVVRLCCPPCREFHRSDLATVSVLIILTILTGCRSRFMMKRSSLTCLTPYAGLEGFFMLKGGWGDGGWLHQ